jgi:hypothetical protein
VHLAHYFAGIPSGILWSILAWGVAVATAIAWRISRLRSWVPVTLTAVELGVLFYLGTTRWGRALELPGKSPVLNELARLAPSGLVGGEAENLPVRAGLATGYPYLGFGLAQPNRLLMLLQQRLVKGEASGPADGISASARVQLLKRFRVSHLVASRPSLFDLGTVVDRRLDPVLNEVIYRAPGDPPVRMWSIVKLGEPIPEARVARRARTIADHYALVDRLARSDDPDLAWFLRADRVPDRPDAQSARLRAWDGAVAEVEHDGPCDLVVARSFVPGWLARINHGPEAPALPVDGGFLAVRLEGSGTDRVALRYRPAGLRLWASVSLASAALAAAVLLVRARTWVPWTRQGLSALATLYAFLA